MAIAGYKIRINGGGLVNQITDVGSVLTYDFTGLTPSTAYAIEVASYNSDGIMSAWSSPFSKTTPAVPTGIAEIFRALKTGDSTSNTTAAINSTGATLIVIGASFTTDFSVRPQVSDSKGNTWIPLSFYPGGGANPGVQLFYCKNPTVGAGHTFTAFGSNLIEGSMGVLGFSSTNTTSPFDGENGNTGTSPTLQPGSLTPSVDGDVIVSAAAYRDIGVTGVPTINSGFTVINAPSSPSQWSLAMAYKVQTTAVAVNPTWTFPAASVSQAASVAAFKKN